MDVFLEHDQWQLRISGDFVADATALAEAVDVLFVTLAASAATRHIVSREVIAALGPHGMLVNISRASNVDEEALLDALENRTVGSAALDVFDGEPNINPRFIAYLQNGVSTPLLIRIRVFNTPG